MASNLTVLTLIVVILVTCAAGKRHRTYYEVLNVTRSATDKEIKLAYYKTSRLYHPDRNNKRNAELRMSEVNRAYEVLKSTNHKAAYDIYLTMNGGFHHPNWDRDGSFSQWQTLMNLLCLSDYYWLWQIIIVLLLLGVASVALGAILTLITPIMKFARSWMFWIMLAMSMFNHASTWMYGSGKKK